MIRIPFFHRPTLFVLIGSMFTRAVLAQDVPPISYRLSIPQAQEHIIVDARTVALLSAELRGETDGPRKAQLLADLNQCPSPDADPPIASAFGDADALVRAAAVRAVIGRSEALATDALRRLAADPAKEVRFEIARLAGSTGHEATLVSLLADADSQVVAAAIAGVKGNASESAMASALPALSPRLQALACERFAAIGSVVGARAAVALLESDGLATRVGAIRAVAAGRQITRQQIERQFAHPLSAVRVAAAGAIAALPEADVRHTLAAMALRDGDLAVRVPAVAVLGGAARSETIALLLPQLSAGYEPLHHATREALVTAAAATALRQTVLDAAGGLLRNTVADRRIDGSYVLGALGANTALADHLRLLDQTEDWRVPAQAASALRTIADPASASALEAFVARHVKEALPATEDDQVRAKKQGIEQAILACAAIGNKNVLASISQLYTTKEALPSWRAAAVYALGMLATPAEAEQPLRTLMGRVNDLEESAEVIQEAICAAGNARVESLRTQLESLVALTGQMPGYAYTARKALDRLDNTQTPFPMPTITRTAQTSVRALTPAAR